jgi:N-acyl-phosphatidylethanolamine-hydrolysing phospholipase D
LGGGFDIGLLPIGAYEPRWFMKDQHCNPEESVQIFHDLHCKQALAVHWGTFQLTDEALDEPPRALKAAKKARGLTPEAFYTLPVGGTRLITPRVKRPG